MALIDFGDVFSDDARARRRAVPVDPVVQGTPPPPVATTTRAAQPRAATTTYRVPDVVNDDLTPKSGNTGVTGGMTGQLTSSARTAQNMPAGVDSEKWLSGHVSPKYAWKEVGSQHNLTTQAGRDAALAQLKQQYPQYFADAAWDGTDILTIGGTPHADFNGLTRFDVIKDVDGAGTVRWGTPEQDAINRQIAAQQAAARAASGGGAGGSGGGSGSPLPAGFDPFGPTNPSSLGPLQFDDPDTKRLLEFVNERVKTLTSGVEDPSVARALDAIYSRADELQAPPFSDTQTAQIRASRLDQLEQDRQGEIRAAVRRLEGMGHAPTSGTIQQAIQEINDHYSGARTAFERDLAVDMIDRTDDRLQQALSLILQAPSITRQARGEQQANLDKALSLLSLPVDLTDRRMQQAMQVLGLGGGANPMGIFNSLANLSAQTAAQANQNSANDSLFWAQLGQLIASASDEGSGS